MANFRYYVRLNFQTRPIGHEQVSTFFKQSYLQKFDLINSVYGPIYNELMSFLEKETIQEWRTQNFQQVRKEKMFLLVQDFDFFELLDDFYGRVEKYNKAIAAADSAIVRLSNNFATKYFKNMAPQLRSVKQIYLDIRAETTHQVPTIYKAILNRRDPVKFWKNDYPFDKIFEIIFGIEYLDDRNQEHNLKIHKDDFSKFVSQLKAEVEEDELIKHVRNEQDFLRDGIDYFLTELKKRM